MLALACTPVPSAPTVDTAPRAGDEEPPFDVLLAFVEQEFEREAVVGGAVAIVLEGQLAWSTGLGLREMGGEEPVTPDTLFNVASTTKTFTAATALALVEDGSVALDTPIGDYVPYFGLAEGYDPASVTLRRLLSHSAAYPNSMVGSPDTSDYDLDAYFANNPDQPLLAPAGEVWNYSNLGFSLASLVAQEAGDEDFRDLVETRVLWPAGMADSTMHVREAKHGEFAYGHCTAYCDQLYVLDPLDYDSEIYWGQGGLWASADDLGRWAEFLLGGDDEVLSEQSRGEMLSPEIATGTLPGSSYGLGLFLSETYGPLTVGHNGDNYGFHAQFLLVPEVGFGVVVLVNSDSYYPSPVTNFAASLFTSYTEPDWAALTPAAEDLQGLVGTYADPLWWGSFEVRYEAGKLWGRFVDSGVEEEIYPSVGNGIYVWDGEDWVYATVWHDEAGMPEYIVARQGVAVAQP